MAARSKKQETASRPKQNVSAASCPNEDSGLNQSDPGVLEPSRHEPNASCAASGHGLIPECPREFLRACPLLVLKVRSSQEVLRRSAGKYDVGSKLGEGTFGQVFLASVKGCDGQVAVKILKSKPDRFLATADLVEVCVADRCVGHDRIVQMLDVFLCPRRDRMCLVFELWGEDLSKLLLRHDGGFEPQTVRGVVNDVACALSHLHNVLQLIHTDVKLTNILARETPGGLLHCKLADVGEARLVARATRKRRALICDSGDFDLGLCLKFCMSS